MAAGDDQRDRGQRDVAVGEERRLDVPRDVVHGDERLAVDAGDGLGRLHARRAASPPAPGPGSRPPRPGPRTRRPASAIAFAITGQMFSRWWRDASSGTTPP